MQAAGTPLEEGVTSVRSRKRFPWSFVLAGVAVLGALLYLVYANTQANAVYYMTVSELKQCTTCTVQSVRVSGIVQAGSIVRSGQSERMTFTVVDGKQTLPVVYTGVVPDIFRAGIQVVVEGHYYTESASASTLLPRPGSGSDLGQGLFQAQTLLAKCPSKFQTAKAPPQ